MIGFITTRFALVKNVFKGHRCAVYGMAVVISTETNAEASATDTLWLREHVVSLDQQPIALMQPRHGALNLECVEAVDKPAGIVVGAPHHRRGNEPAFDAGAANGAGCVAYTAPAPPVVQAFGDDREVEFNHVVHIQPAARGLILLMINNYLQSVLGVLAVPARAGA